MYLHGPAWNMHSKHRHIPYTQVLGVCGDVPKRSRLPPRAPPVGPPRQRRPFRSSSPRSTFRSCLESVSPIPAVFFRLRFSLPVQPSKPAKPAVLGCLLPDSCKFSTSLTPISTTATYRAALFTVTLAVSLPTTKYKCSVGSRPIRLTRHTPSNEVDSRLGRNFSKPHHQSEPPPRATTTWILEASKPRSHLPTYNFRGIHAAASTNTPCAQGLALLRRACIAVLQRRPLAHSAPRRRDRIVSLAAPAREQDARLLLSSAVTAS